jgi:N-acetylglucosamine kinase-like BadF-type ATPase
MGLNQCYVAVDGGNSKTEYRLLDADGAVIVARRGGGSNHETTPGGLDGAADVIIEEIEEMLAAQDFAMADIADAVLGLAGADFGEEAEALAGALQVRGLTHCYVCNDGYLGVMAGLESGVGICYSAGSGVTCAGIGAEGKCAQFGGMGELSGDTGGGYDIAAFVYRCVYEHLFFGKTYTTLKDAFFTLFDIHTPDEFRSAAGRILTEEAAKQLVGLFFTAVETGDELALRYAALSASHAADCIIAAADALSLKQPVQVALSGSIMTAVAPPAYRRMIEYELYRRKGKSFNLRVNDRPPVDGAVRWVRIRNNLPNIL